ncbi:MAG: NAD(P)H-binding protein [Planctomycetales bacterium]|nr:NAD(P)H-binding protein [bacterium]UNM09688.1 MAG: NAD(P)H-binding protein [Planctomycetales bacterium]
MDSQRTIAITAPLGNIGQLLLGQLLDAGVNVRAMSKNPLKLACSPNLRKIAGCIHDPADIRRLVEGADTLFWAIPPDFQSPDVLDWYRRAGDAAAEALQGSGIRRIVYLSSLGAELGSETGLVYGHHLVEERLNGLAADVLHLRSAYFMENFLTCLMSIGEQKRICRPVSGSRSFPMVSTSDVASIAAASLLDTDWHGQLTLEIHGPCDMSLDEAVGILADELGMELSYEQQDGAHCLEHLTQIGMGDSMAGLLVRTYEWIEQGTPDYASRRDPLQTWQHDFRSFVKSTFAPIFSSLS